ncbi:3-oxoacyl-[acyl-carrier-protein] synthase III C-terminal domain-containing protein [Bacillus sp. FJAT-50079]|uniref:type III polyketide synthase n=1 Tax=Bacillus sp. FJAT-50079 TaxID=2833577 RepID=UPI001BC9171F|nr:3-oxoacyl-[acyl-carrier-protein] synthase III C-terminal domain-containing protein [Bacillus sp. FJAT-50079]MBS4209817.1 type III polyketide synthase [Bacillus sp. FJAT-50079]
MPRIISVGTGIPSFAISQQETMELTKQLFSDSIKDLDRLLHVFHNGDIVKRHFVKSIDWYKEDHSFSEKNTAFIREAETLAIEAIQQCMNAADLKFAYNEIDAIFMVTTTGIATPSLDARIMNQLPFSPHMKRVPIWGLGCAGGAAGLSRAYEYCLAYPGAKVLLVAVELCSLTFQKDDISKSNLIGASLFADGAAAVLITGDEVHRMNCSQPLPKIIATQSTLMPDSLNVMGWDIKDHGLYVVFSKSIPSIVEKWLEPNVQQFLTSNGIDKEDIAHFVAHPGGKKVIAAYEKALRLDPEKSKHSRTILNEYGNMSSVTVLFVLQKFLEEQINVGDYGLITALGPGFSSELLLLRWS